MYNNRFKDNDEYKFKIDTYTPLKENILKQIKAYFKISFTYTSNAFFFSHLPNCYKIFMVNLSV